ncbi:MAG TPA: (Fe-S)-binding protein [Anaerolineales bacterium]|nr:(Fe-S)-binding protein [Anaerolineales bacterium]
MKTRIDVSLVDNLTQLQLVAFDACTRCNECLNWCPVLDVTDDESLATPEKIRIYGDLIRARHGLLSKFARPLNVENSLLEKLKDALYTCTTCGRCGEVCEVGINTQQLWPAMREKLVEMGMGPMGAQDQTGPLTAEHHNPYGRPHAQRFAWLPPAIEVADRAEIGFYVGCSGAYVAQPMVIGAVRAFAAVGAPFTLFPDEWCCGFPLFIIGDNTQVAEIVRHNVEGFAARGVKKLLVSCPCCTFMLRERWPEFYGGELPFEIVHTTQFIAEMIAAGKFKLTKGVPGRLTYHDPCYLSRGVRVIEEPRAVIAQIPNVDFVEMAECRERSKCCGAGGGLRRCNPALSVEMARRLMADAEAVGADTLVIDCPACFERMHLAQGGMVTDLKIVDLMELVTQLF